MCRVFRCGNWLLAIGLVLSCLAGISGANAAPNVSRTTAELDLRALRVNELGVVPVLMYHAFTTNPTTDPFTRSLDDFWADLTWLYKNNFQIVSLEDLITNTIDIPAGKHPVVLTFDDAAARQFQFTTDAEGNAIPAPDTAVGTMEAFFALYPDIGRGGHFAIVGQNCFTFKTDPDRSPAWEAECGRKLQWLADHGYEIGNHTWSHPNLGLLDAATFDAEVGRNAAFINRLVQGPGNQSDILTLPFGEAPPPGSQAESDMYAGFTWESSTYTPRAVVRVGHGMTPSPASSDFSPMAITRINTDPASLATWFGQIERREVIAYTSDGDPRSVAVPDPVPVPLASQLDPDLIARSGHTLVRFADDGRYVEPALTALPPLRSGVTVVTADQGVRLRQEPSTTAVIERRLRNRTLLTVQEGPVVADAHTWWRVETADGITGWVAEDFLAGPPAG